MAKRETASSDEDENPLSKYRMQKDTKGGEPKAKKPRTSEASTGSSSSGSDKPSGSAGNKIAIEKTAEGDQYIALGRDLRRVVVREFKGKKLIDIRDFYKDKGSGDIKPSSKGISLTPEQWDLLKANFDTIDTMINEKK